MSGLARRFYQVLVALHPAAFRNEFGREMLLDFAEAVRDRKVALRLLYWDGLVSLGRQWMFRGPVLEAAPQTVAAGSSLLLGRYGRMDGERMTAWELLRGLALSAAVIAALAMVPMRAVRSLREPSNPLGARGSVPGGTGEMQHGGAAVPGARATTVTVTAPALRPATATEISESPAMVAAITAASMSGGPRPAMVLVKEKFSAFDVASVRENRSGGKDIHMNFPLGQGNYGFKKTGGILRVENLPLAAYISFAYNMSSYQNSKFREHLPEWVRSTRYDIEARVEGEPSKDEMRGMMRALLVERFKLQIHPETHEAQAQQLMVAKPGKLGPGLVAHASDDPDCKAMPVPKSFNPCGALGVIPGPVSRVVGRNVSMEGFAGFIDGYAGSLVVDRTGLPGNYDYTLDLVEHPAPDEPAATFPQALQQQMGLKLVPGKAMVETWVVDDVQKPTGN